MKGRNAQVDGMDLGAYESQMHMLKADIIRVKNRILTSGSATDFGSFVTARLEDIACERMAVEDAQKVLERTGVDAALYAIAGQERTVRAFGEETHENAVSLLFLPLRCGYPCMDTHTFHGYDDERPDTEETVYAPSYPQESLQIVMEDGKVLTYRHSYPSTVRNVAKEAAPLLPFGEIQRLFREWIGRSIYVCKGDPLTVRVHTVRLVMRRMPQKNVGEDWKTADFWLLPAWEFIGSVRAKSDTITAPHLDNETVLRLNAIDGSVIE
ncbi:MAG: hypothetical protein IJL59_08940, partial [Clostridia bacterium]|nr:hypothetical protein [Clostridia bacterium]